MLPLLPDEDFDEDVSQILRVAGYDVKSVQDQKLRGINDPQVLQTATEQGRVVLTCNRWDYIALHRNDQSHAGIVVCTRDADFLALAARIHQALQSAGDMKGKLIRVNRPSN